jgi:hypothetical protein
VAAAAPVVSLGVVVAGAWASGEAELARSCDATTLRSFDVIRDPSFTRAELRRGTSVFVVGSRSGRERSVLQTVKAPCFA